MNRDNKAQNAVEFLSEVINALPETIEFKLVSRGGGRSKTNESKTNNHNIAIQNKNI